MVFGSIGLAFCRFFVVLGVVFWSASNTLSATEGRRVALVVGNGAYDAIPSLDNPSRDAALIAAKLRAVGFDVELAIDGDFSTLKQSVRSFGQRAQGADAALFYYAGHGLQADGRNYLLPVDAQLGRIADLKYETLPLSLVMTELEFADAKINLVVLDACRDNPLTRSLARTSKTRAVDLGQGLASVQRASGTFIAYATAPGQVAYDGNGTLNSPFTKALADWIEKPDLEIALMFRRVREQVVAATAGKQTPWVEEAILGDFYFQQNAAPATAIIPARIAKQQEFPQQPPPPKLDSSDIVTAWSQAEALHTREAYKQFLRQYPNSVYSQEAVTRLSRLASPETPAMSASSIARQQQSKPTRASQPAIKIIEGTSKIPNLY